MQTNTIEKMKCTHCSSDNTQKYGKEPNTGKQRYKCTDCGKQFTPDSKLSKPKVGISLSEFRDKHDVEYIISKTLDQLEKTLVYEKADLIKLSGLPYSAQGLSTILESKTAYYGKISGKVYYSHPDTIKMLKDDAKLN